MIPIKTITKPISSEYTTNSSTSSGTSVSMTSNADKWFYFDNDTNSVCCRYDLYSVGNVSAFGADPMAGEGGGTAVNVEDNLTSYSTTYALSANQGRVLKSMIDNIQIGGGGQVLNTVDWSNITNKPNSFTPSAHTHNVSDVNNLQSYLNTLTNNVSSVTNDLAAHEASGSVHMTQQQRDFLNLLMSVCTIANGTVTLNTNIVASGNITANAT